MADIDRVELVSVAACLTQWLGRSGKNYGLKSENLDSFTLASADLYVLAQGATIRWVGTADDLVADTTCRAQFRQALASATQAFSLNCAENAQAVAWDLIGTQGPARQQAA